MSKKVLIPLAEGCEELEAVTLIDLFRRANLDVTTASLTSESTVLCSRGTRLVADANLQSVIEDDGNKEGFDLIVLPGGLPGADNLNNDKRIHQLLSEATKAGQYIAAICAAPRVLINNENLVVKRMTAYPGALEHLDTSNIELSKEDIVKDGNIITAKGPGTAMDFALELIEILLGKKARKSVEEPLYRSSI
ncbi:MAG: DJ-1 family glyoxalase III [Thiotrichaceae bacterium]